MPANVKINSANHSYTIKIRKGLVERLGLEILKLNDDSDTEIALITDEKVSGLYLQKVIMNFQKCPKPEGTKLRICEILIDSHETSKNFRTVSKMLEEIAALGFSERVCIAALGGGVVCDAAGFAAGCYKNGVRLVLIPTTIAAMVKSSAGGHARLNLSAGENLAGMSYNPSLVLCDTECLRTLPDDEYRSGLSEAFKTSIVAGGEIFRMFERGIDSGNIEKLIEECVKFRADISGNDDMQKALKLGCVVGSAIGALSMYEIQHGLATAQGIAITVRAAGKLGWCSEETSERIINAMTKNNLPVTCKTFTPNEISHAALANRNQESNINIVIASEIGKCGIKSVKADELERIISVGMAM
ncbi:MAG: 3-dehydroquinate synthase [Synergistaceae bacterium]|nr:3-dehydroquinate synthase [Synergistaceae bacterium]MBQ3693327.1 3-dehydroquinate synthase [Synergistaceae bacterium]MBR0251614.1 3-dehydroquinate synthase [Synergistaceae bacterium]